MAHHTMFKVKDPESVSALTYMPHEDAPVTTFEDERLKAIRKKSAQAGFDSQYKYFGEQYDHQL